MAPDADAGCMGIVLVIAFVVAIVLAPIYGADTTEGRTKI